MKSFAEYTVEDFAAEPLFIQWVQRPQDAELSNFWQVYLQNNPEKTHEVSQAKVIVSHVSDFYEGIDQGEVFSLWRRIVTSVGTFNSAPNNSYSIYLLIGFITLVMAIALGLTLAWR